MPDASTARELIDFLLTLSQDPEKAAYKTDPQAFMEGAGVSADTQAIILSGQSAALSGLAPSPEMEHTTTSPRQL